MVRRKRSSSVAWGGVVVAWGLCIVLTMHDARAAELLEIDWQQVIAPASLELPSPANEVIWHDDLKAAMREAATTGRPLFVTMRCLPCKQCADFDKDVLEGGSQLDPLLLQYVCVRLIDAFDIDLRMFPVEGFQDTDLSWWGWLFSDRGELYSVYGGRDEVSDSTRISEASLIKTLQRVLEHHYHPRRPDWKLDGDVPQLTGQWQSPRTLPGFNSWDRHTAAAEKTGCLHCHQVGEILRQPAIDRRTFDKHRDLDIWPLPENVGLTVERDDGLLVRSVKPGSAADAAGLQEGDTLVAADGRRLFSQADFRGVLHRGPRGSGSIDVVWQRDGRAISGTLQTAEGWRTTVLDWRASVSGGNIGAAAGFFPIVAKPTERDQLKIADDKMAVRPYVNPESPAPAVRAGLRREHIITAVNGQSPNLSGRSFLTWFRMQYEPGDEITLDIVSSNGRTGKIRYTAE